MKTNFRKMIAICTTTFVLASCSSDNISSSDSILTGNVTSITGAEGIYVSDVAVAANGDVYATDQDNRIIKKIETSNGSNTVTIFAGNGTAEETDATVTATGFAPPKTLAFSPDYQTLYVGTWFTIRAIDMATKEVTTIAGNYGGQAVDGIGTEAGFAYPTDIVINSSETIMYVSENVSGISGEHKRIRKVNLATKEVTTLSWNNLPTNFSPGHMVIDKNDEFLYVPSQQVILKMNLQTNDVTVLAGTDSESGTFDGIGSEVRFHNPYSLAFSPNDDFMYVSQGNGSNNYRGVRVIDMKTNEVTTLIANGSGFEDGDNTTAKFDIIQGMCYDKNSNILYAADTYNGAVRVIE